MPKINLQNVFTQTPKSPEINQTDVEIPIGLAAGQSAAMQQLAQSTNTIGQNLQQLGLKLQQQRDKALVLDLQSSFQNETAEFRKSLLDPEKANNPLVFDEDGKVVGGWTIDYEKRMKHWMKVNQKQLNQMGRYNRKVFDQQLNIDLQRESTVFSGEAAKQQLQLTNAKAEIEIENTFNANPSNMDLVLGKIDSLERTDDYKLAKKKEYADLFYQNEFQKAFDNITNEVITTTRPDYTVISTPKTARQMADEAIEVQNSIIQNEFETVEVNGQIVAIDVQQKLNYIRSLQSVIDRKKTEEITNIFKVEDDIRQGRLDGRKGLTEVQKYSWDEMMYLNQAWVKQKGEALPIDLQMQLDARKEATKTRIANPRAKADSYQGYLELFGKTYTGKDRKLTKPEKDFREWYLKQNKMNNELERLRNEGKFPEPKIINPIDYTDEENQILAEYSLENPNATPLTADEFSPDAFTASDNLQSWRLLGEEYRDFLDIDGVEREIRSKEDGEMQSWIDQFTDAGRDLGIPEHLLYSVIHQAKRLRISRKQEQRSKLGVETVFDSQVSMLINNYNNAQHFPKDNNGYSALTDAMARVAGDDFVDDDSKAAFTLAVYESAKAELFTVKEVEYENKTKTILVEYNNYDPFMFGPTKTKITKTVVIPGIQEQEDIDNARRKRIKNMDELHLAIKNDEIGTSNVKGIDYSNQEVFGYISVQVGSTESLRGANFPIRERDSMAFSLFNQTLYLMKDATRGSDGTPNDDMSRYIADNTKTLYTGLVRRLMNLNDDFESGGPFHIGEKEVSWEKYFNSNIQDYLTTMVTNSSYVELIPDLPFDSDFDQLLD